MNTLQHNIFVC